MRLIQGLPRKYPLKCYFQIILIYRLFQTNSWHNQTLKTTGDFLYIPTVENVCYSVR